MKTLDCLSTVLFLEAIVLSLIASLRFINIQSTALLIIFNLLFFTLIFQLNGSLPKKFFVLTLGNIIGFFWNLIFYYFSIAGYDSFGKPFNVFYTLVYPFLNLMWIVPYSLIFGRIHIIFSPGRQNAWVFCSNGK
jgi:hypothetical protein